MRVLRESIGVHTLVFSRVDSERVGWKREVGKEKIASIIYPNRSENLNIKGTISYYAEFDLM